MAHPLSELLQECCRLGCAGLVNGWPFWHINSVACTSRLFIGLTLVFRASKD